MRNLADDGLLPVLHRKVLEEKTPVLGICLGFQLMSDHGEEGDADGLGWIGFDPALAVCPTENHIRVAAGLDAVGTVGVRTVPALTGDAVETIAITAL